MSEARSALGRRVIVTGLAGSGKSTLSLALAAKTGLPVIHLDLHFWKPGWVAPSESEWREKQCDVLAGDAWIADGNYDETLDLRLERADTVVFLDMPWWLCAGRAFLRGFSMPDELPEGCEYSVWLRLRDEWRLAVRIWRNRRSEPERERELIAQHGQHVALHVLRSKRAVSEFLDGLDAGRRGQTGSVTLTADYDSDPGRWSAWHPAQDVHDVIGPELRGPVLDVGCGQGRLTRSLRAGVVWVGMDRSWKQLAGCAGRPVVQADMRALPFRDGVFAEVTHLWCLYHVDDPVTAISEARRVVRPAGRYYACANARTSDSELMWEGYPASPFDAEEAAAMVGQVFDGVVEEPWDDQLYTLETREEVARFCRSHFIPPERAEQVDVPLRLTKRGVLVRATSEQRRKSGLRLGWFDGD